MYSPSRPTSTSPRTPVSALPAVHGQTMPEILFRPSPQQHVDPQYQPHLQVLNSINRVSRTYYSKQDQDTIYAARHPGISTYRQADMRRESCETIALIGKRIGFPQHTISTAQLLLHRFFMFNAVSDSGNEVVMACLFVSSKVEDTIKKLKDIMTATYLHRHPHVTDWDPESKEGEEQRKRVLSYEKMVLESICFDFRIIHPYKYIVKFVKIMKGSKNLARQAWFIARDSYKIGVCLEYPPHTIAAGSIYLASKLTEEPFPDLIIGEPWMKALRTRSIDVEGRSEDQRHHYTKIHIALNEARQLDMDHQQPKLKRARTDYARPLGVKAGKFSVFGLHVAKLERIQDGGASNPTVRYSQS
ncbi:RNA polymerase II C-terminal domain kinase beta subunit [Gryganskiella cystojenkinii]|nr:RNA polymerase II C-terminal domain kinase beta subunit [Gryganskiella cystojenkinii]